MFSALRGNCIVGRENGKKMREKKSGQTESDIVRHIIRQSQTESDISVNLERFPYVFF